MKAGARVFQIVDVERVNATNPLDAIKIFVLDKKPKVVECDVFIAGGGMGGVASAIRASQQGLTVCVSEETSMIGGQMTSQGVSAFDENKYVEETGATKLYQELRTRIRQHYRNMDGASPEAKANERLNPGDCWVSWCSFEPMIGEMALQEIIDEETEGKPQIDFHTRTKVVAVKAVRGRIVSALTVHLDTGKFSEFRTKFLIDATELGDIIPMLNIPYATGAESHEETGEAHAPVEANPDNVQDFTYPFVLEYYEGENHTIPKPAKYDEFNRAGKFSFLNYKMFGGELPFWTYRRLVAKHLFPGAYKSDVSMINWEANDCRGENLIDVGNEKQAEHLADGKLISLGFLHWLQTEAPRDEGGKGYPECKLVTNVLGTNDGLSMYPYIRESRRIKAKKVIKEEEIAEKNNPGSRAKLFRDSVGIGLYPIDIHGHQDVPGAGQHSKPFQIPLSAMVQTHIRNFLPACKNIGTTHVTNGAYRLHPIEWAIGEAAGLVAAYCVKHKTKPEAVQQNSRKLGEIQKQLVELGSPIFWFDDVKPTDPDFVQIQLDAVSGKRRVSDEHLHARS